MEKGYVVEISERTIHWTFIRILEYSQEKIENLWRTRIKHFRESFLRKSKLSKYQIDLLEYLLKDRIDHDVKIDRLSKILHDIDVLIY